MPQTTDPKDPRHRKSVTPARARHTLHPRTLAGSAPPRGSSGAPASSATPAAPAEPAEPVDPRTRWIGLSVIGGAAVIAFVVTVGIFLPAIGALTSGGVVTQADPRALPAEILVCDREYASAGDPVERTLEEVRRRDGRDPVVVSAVADAGCPAGVCIEGGLCLPVVYVRTASDGYIEYVLQEGL